jgi:sulfur-oxidizing protein SoxA
MRNLKLAIGVFTIASISLLGAANFNAQAEKDRKALISYMEKKFADPVKNKGQFFPYSTDKELAKYAKGIKRDTFRLGSYSYDMGGREQYNDVMEMPPFDDNIDAGKALYEKKFANGKSFKDCFPDPAISGEYPRFDDASEKVMTLTTEINSCLKASGEKPWKMKKGKMADLEAYFASESTKAGKKVHIVIQSKAAADAYERGKKAYYSQRGYLKLSCATCHVQGTGKRVRNEYMSPLLGHTTHFPVYRLKWQGLGTLERRIEGCNKDEGENPHKPGSQWMSEVLYFMAYMSNEMPIDGPAIRK